LDGSGYDVLAHPKRLCAICILGNSASVISVSMWLGFCQLFKTVIISI